MGQVFSCPGKDEKFALEDDSLVSILVEKRINMDDDDENEPLVVPQNSQSSTFGRIVNWAAEDKPLWLTAYGFLGAHAVLAAAEPKLFSDAVAAATTNPSMFFARLTNLAGITCALTISGTIYLCSLNEAQTRMEINLERKLLKSVTDQEFKFFHSVNAGEIVAAQDTHGPVQVAAGLFPTVLHSGIRGVTTIGILWGVDHRLAMLTMLAAPFGAIITRYSSYLNNRYQSSTINYRAISNSLMSETVEGIIAVKTLSGEKRQQSQYWEYSEQKRELQSLYRTIIVGKRLLVDFLPNATGIALMYCGFVWASAGTLDVSVLMLSAMYPTSIQSSIGSLMDAWISWSGIMGQSKLLLGYLDRQPNCLPKGEHTTGMPEESDMVDEKGVEKVRPSPRHGIYGRISLEGVSYSYDKKNALFQDVNLEINPGELIAIVGPTGGGKSTLLSIIAGLYDPIEGSAKIDGRPINEFDPAFLYVRGLSVVTQTPVLFTGTVEENITFGLKHQVSHDELLRATKAACAHDFIMELPDGYQTQVGAHGGKLSGGQRQLVSIARALLRDPAILLMDEPTSALDNRSEQALTQALQSIMKDRTVVIVAHRLSTIQNVKRIALVDKGKVCQGTPEELMSKNPVFRELVECMSAESGTPPAGTAPVVEFPVHPAEEGAGDEMEDGGESPSPAAMNAPAGMGALEEYMEGSQEEA